jgi:(1->4)-alpha-D-glucan 1-alpha-D-glucosylmutase
MTFIDRIVDPRRPFVESFRPFQQRIADIGVINSLAQLVIKCTAPGVPDFYQGTELWDLSLVDPDNRRPVDYERRKAFLDELRSLEPAVDTVQRLLEGRVDGRVKMYTMIRALAVRHGLRDTFMQGDYVPLAASGPAGDRVFAFARVHDGPLAITCVPRLVASMLARGVALPLGEECWGDTRLLVPPMLLPPRALTNAFTGEAVAVTADGTGASALRVADLFAHFPVAIVS